MQQLPAHKLPIQQLRSMAVFAHIVEAGSITAAADKLDLSKSVISQHLKQLEENLGVALLKRTTRRQTLTVAGERFYSHCSALNQLVDSAWQEAQNSKKEPSGRVRITAPNALMTSLVAPAIGEVLQRYPTLEPELISSDKHLDLVADDIDLAIRVGQSGESQIKQRRIGTFRDCLCGHQSLLQNQQLSDLPYIANSWEVMPINYRLSNAQGEEQAFQADVKTRVDSVHSAEALILGGSGIGLLPDFIFKQHSSVLVEVYPGFTPAENNLYALYPYTSLLPLSVRICLGTIEMQLTNLA